MPIYPHTECTKPPASRALLEKFGFLPTLQESKVGAFYVKEISAWDMPYMREHVIDGENLYEDDIVIIKVCPFDLVWVSTKTSDYFEDPVPLKSQEARGILKDAGVIFDDD